MKLATLRDNSRDGSLLLVSRDLSQAVSVRDIAPTLQVALEQWDQVAGRLEVRYQALCQGLLPEAFCFDSGNVMAPLPRAYQWCDASAFLNHGRLMQKAFNLPAHEEADTIPLMYQGASDDFLGPTEDVPLPDENHGIDFEGEFAIVTGEVRMGCKADVALKYIRLLMLVNDVSLRGLGPREMKSGFGFLQAKPSSSFAPVAVTPDELGEAWHEGRVHLPLSVSWNGQWFGRPNGGEMSFGFGELIAHAAKTRRLRAGTIIGSGTVSNSNPALGAACIAERRMIEMLETGTASTGFMRFGDRVSMSVSGTDGQSLFGAIDQKIVCSTQSGLHGDN